MPARRTVPARLTQVVPISGKSTKGNKQFSGTYTIERFVAKGSKIYSVGTVKGKLGAKKVTKENVQVPATVANASAPAAGQAQASQVRRSRCRRSRPATPARSSASTSARST